MKAFLKSNSLTSFFLSTWFGYRTGFRTSMVTLLNLKAVSLTEVLTGFLE